MWMERRMWIGRMWIGRMWMDEEDIQYMRVFAMAVKCFFVSKVTDTRLKKLEKDYQSFLEQQAQLEDPVVRLEVRLRGVAKGVY